jgi:hypothetical protein
MIPVTAHLDLVTELVKGTTAGAQRRLLRNHSQVALLAGAYPSSISTMRWRPVAISAWPWTQPERRAIPTCRSPRSDT